MTADMLDTTSPATRITLVVNGGLRPRIVEILAAQGVTFLFVEQARLVRQRMRKRMWPLPGLRAELTDAPTDVFRLAVSREAASGILGTLAQALELRTPGRGAIYAQDLIQIGGELHPPSSPPPREADQLRSELSLITGIQSKSTGGEKLYSTALKLGVGVPVVRHGIGAGIRDRLGLLRITIAPEKEVVGLMVPSHDADGLQRLLIDEAHLDRPGGGFLYQTPIRAGSVDPLIRIGRQEHAASIEQMIAAIDDLKRGTAWRKRFSSLDATGRGGPPDPVTHREVSFICLDGRGDSFVHAAMEAGAEGATVSRLRRLTIAGPDAGKSASCESGILCISAGVEEDVLRSLCATAAGEPDGSWLIQSLVAGAVFSHKRG